MVSLWHVPVELCRAECKQEQVEASLTSCEAMCNRIAAGYCQVRCAGYDSVFIPRRITRLNDAKIKNICKIGSLSRAKALSVSIDASLRQSVASLAQISNAGSEAAGDDKEPAHLPEEGKQLRLGRASMV